MRITTTSLSVLLLALAAMACDTQADVVEPDEAGPPTSSAGGAENGEGNASPAGSGGQAPQPTSARVDAGSPTVSAGGAGNADYSPAAVGDGIEALQIDGVWVFQYETEPDVIMEALHSGPVEIVDGCLFVEDMIVIWHPKRLSDVEAAIAAVQAGGSLELRTGGGGFSLDEGSTADEIPTVIAERCSTTGWWYGSPD